MKKIIFKITCLLLFVCFAIPATACSENSEYEYEVVGDYVKITRYLGKGGKLNMPNTYKDLPIKVLGSLFLQGSTEEEIQEIDFPDYLEEIEGWAFLSSSVQPKVLIFPNSLKSIGTESFNSINSLEKVYFGPNIEYIGKNAFGSCNNLTHVGFESSSLWEVSNSVDKFFYSHYSGAAAAQYLRDFDYRTYTWKKIN